MSPVFVFLFVSFLAVVEGECTGSALSNCMQGVPSKDSNQFCWLAEVAMACANELMGNCKDTGDQSYLEALATLNIAERGQQFEENCFS